MKTKLFKIYLLSFFILSDFIMFAQDPGDEGDGDGGLEGNDPDPVPVNSKLIWLGVIALIFAFYKLKINHKEA